MNLYILCFCFIQHIVFSLGLHSPNSMQRIRSALNSDSGITEEIVVGESSSSGRFQDAPSYTSFLLYTRRYGKRYTTVYPHDVDSFSRGGFDPSKKIKILFHGWINNGITRAMGLLKAAYLATEDVNIISVHWPKVCIKAYPIACTAVTPVGQYAAQLIDFLVTELGVKPSNIHLVGYSLGAHTAGAAAKHVTSCKIHRITGLDPARPKFSNHPSGRLDRSDAHFVDVIHTDCGMLGIANSIGTVDFYPNSGYAPQPGCNIGSSVTSHWRSYEFFAESIRSDRFVATQCDSWQNFKRGLCQNRNTTLMGEHVHLSARGVYYLYTNARSPYAVG